MEEENKTLTVDEKEPMHLVKDCQPEDVFFSEMEIDHGVEDDKGEGSDAIFSREVPLVCKGHIRGTSIGRSRASELEESEVQKKDKTKQEKKLSRQDRIELGRMFQRAVSSQDLKFAEDLILVADPRTLNDMLCIALDSIWFLTTRKELSGITGLIKKIVENGENDFTRAALRMSFLASCVSACQSRTMSLSDTVGIMVQRLHERLQECHGDEVLKAEASVKV